MEDKRSYAMQKVAKEWLKVLETQTEERNVFQSSG